MTPRIEIQREDCATYLDRRVQRFALSIEIASETALEPSGHQGGNGGEGGGRFCRTQGTDQLFLRSVECRGELDIKKK